MSSNVRSRIPNWVMQELLQRLQTEINTPPPQGTIYRGFSMLKIIVFLVNIAVFIYLLRDFPKNKAE
ncbi:hypothetical protein Cri9333_2005 [Crinalium epipsammum PCC 9333]|uniref:Uncharacterized protein n=1 Tax=Crinalium epipsammum PCC 9333 TaxID=1173022 RepID=K9VZB2_9CYAN|nr:hypothetical protein [Crinalium epipsammum]AFZ12884.1 hypothetical protein Cri9333_2005 [Crinalium epipsammum PCC 9333]